MGIFSIVNICIVILYNFKWINVIIKWLFSHEYINIGKFYTYPYLFAEVYTFLTNRKLLFIHSWLIPISMSKASLYSYAEKKISEFFIGKFSFFGGNLFSIYLNSYVFVVLVKFVIGRINGMFDGVGTETRNFHH